MGMIYFLFWTSLAVLFYCYIGYGLFLYIWNYRKRGKKFNAEGRDQTMPITLVVAAFNEAPVLEDKILNTLAIDYPEKHLDIIFITDGSTDDSSAIVSKYPRIKAMH